MSVTNGFYDGEDADRHPIAVGVRDSAVLRKQVMQLELEQEGEQGQEWADPLHQQYRVIFESLSYLEQELDKYSNLV